MRFWFCYLLLSYMLSRGLPLEEESGNVSKCFVLFLAQYSGCNARENVIQIVAGSST